METYPLPGGLAGPPGACSTAPDRLDVFAVGAGGTVWRWSSNGGPLLAPVPLPANGSIPAEGLCAIASSPGSVEVFAVDGRTRLPVWWRGNGATWTIGPVPLGGTSIPAVPPAAVAASAANIDLFAVGNDRTPWWWHWNGSVWMPPVRLPDDASLSAVRVAAVSPSPGRLDVFAVGANRHLWHWWKEGATPWNIQDLGGDMPADGVSAVCWGPGRVDVFAASRLPGDPLLHWWTDGAAFSGPENLGGSLANGTVCAVSTGANRLDVFGITRDQRLAQWQWDGQAWSGPSFRGDHLPAGDVTAAARRPGRIEVFARGGDSALRHWPGGGIETATNEPWSNFATNQQRNPVTGRLRPASLDELVTMVQEAERGGQSVRAVGSAWSNSDVAVPPGYVIDTDYLSGMLTHVLDTSLNAMGAGLRLVHVEAGIKLYELVDRLTVRGLALTTLGGSTGQSLAGALSTGVHGMDIDRGPLPDMVRAIHLVGPGGAQHWIEPASRIITDRAALVGALNIPDENIHYDDDWFGSVLVSVGSLGVIYSLVVEVDRQYDLVDTREELDWTAMKTRLTAGGGPGDPFATSRGVQVVVNPYPAGDGSRRCYLTTRTQEAASTANTGPNLASLLGFFAPGLLAGFRADRSTVDDVLNPLTKKQQMDPPNPKRGWAHTITGGSDPGPIRGLAVEVMFDATTPQYLGFVDAALEIIRAAYYDEPGSPAYLGWISLRYQGRSAAYLAPQHNASRTCTVEFAAVWFVPGLPGVGWAETPVLLDRIERKARELGGIQHWGMNSLLDASDVVRAYPRLDTWRRVRWELTRGGTLTTFDSDFTRRCGLSAAPAFVRAADFDGDRKTDLAVWRPGSSEWLILNSNGWTERSARFGEIGDIPVPGDYDGDGRVDLAVWRPRTGTWIVAPSAVPVPTVPMAPGGVLRPGRIVTGGAAVGIVPPPAELVRQLGQPGDIPVPGDYDGDGKTDYAVWRPDTGTWFVIGSSTGTQRSQQWGQAGDIPVPGDYDGDGKTDFAVWRPSTGMWLVIDSRNGATRTQQWGQAGDIPVPADYAGDKRTDFAVFRPSTGTWFIIDSATGAQRSRQWGEASDIPVPGDYDGDGKADLAVWRPSTGTWWIVDSATGADRAVQWGRFGDVPV